MERNAFDDFTNYVRPINDQYTTIGGLVIGSAALGAFGYWVATHMGAAARRGRETSNNRSSNSTSRTDHQRARSSSEKRMNTRTE